MGLVYWFAVLPDKHIVFLGAYLSLKCEAPLLTRVVDRSRCLSDACGDCVVLVQGWKAVEFEPGYGVGVS